MFRRLGALEKLFLFARSSPPPPPVRMRWHSFSASWTSGRGQAENSLLLNLSSVRPELRVGPPGIRPSGVPSMRVCRSVPRLASCATARPAVAAKAFSCNQFKISSYKWFRANSRAISTSGIKGFKSTEMNTCRKMGGGHGCLSVFSLEHAPHLNAVVTSEQLLAQTKTRGGMRAGICFSAAWLKSLRGSSPARSPAKSALPK